MKKLLIIVLLFAGCKPQQEESITIIARLDSVMAETWHILEDNNFRNRYDTIYFTLFPDGTYEFDHHWEEHDDFDEAKFDSALTYYHEHSPRVVTDPKTGELLYQASH